MRTPLSHAVRTGIAQIILAAIAAALPPSGSRPADDMIGPRLADAQAMVNRAYGLARLTRCA